MTTSMPHIDGLYETHLTVADLTRSIAFYRDVVGLELAKTFAERRIAFFWINDKKTSMLGLWETGSGPLRMHLHIALRMTVAGVLASAAALQAHGVAPLGFHGEPSSEPVVLSWMPAVSQYFADPDGHSIEFIAILDEAADDAFGIGPYSAWLAR
ncbi:lactoylglutathione lyase [Devosia sp. UYZn731]|uniref:VOC family protein n=1 Tax=Devosia sp. UYZn731 TaxID=3156345 RepID=UPI003391FB9A